MTLNRVRSTARLALVCAALTACSTGPGGGSGDTTGASASCAAVVVYDGHTYWGHDQLKRDPRTTGRVVRGVVPACDDTGGQDEVARDEPVEVTELADVPLETAFLLGDSLFVRDGRELPAAAARWFRAPRCTTDGELDLTGDWLGVTTPHEPRFDGDLRLPYRLELHVTGGPREYVGTTIRVHAGAGTDPALGPRDVKRSLWKGGPLHARVSCADGRFEAVALRALRRTSHTAGGMSLGG